MNDRLDERIKEYEEMKKTAISTVGEDHQLTRLLTTVLLELLYIRDGKTPNR